MLCMAGPETTAVVQQVAASARLSVRPVKTTAEALRLLVEQRRRPGIGDPGGCRALVAALGVSASNFLFNEGYGDRSDLISLAKQLGCIVVVYSHTAVHDRDTSRACMDVGADAVVATAADLQQQLTVFSMADAIKAADLTPRQVDVNAGSAAQSKRPDAVVALSLSTPEGRAFPALPVGAADNRAELDYYPPLLRRAHRDEELISLLGEQPGSVPLSYRPSF